MCTRLTRTCRFGVRMLAELWSSSRCSSLTQAIWPLSGVISPQVVSPHRWIHLSPTEVLLIGEEALFNKGPPVTDGRASVFLATELLSLSYSVAGLLPSNQEQVPNSRHRGHFLGLTAHVFCNEPHLPFCCVGEADPPPVSGRVSLPMQLQGEVTDGCLCSAGQLGCAR